MTNDNLNSSDALAAAFARLENIVAIDSQHRKIKSYVTIINFVIIYVLLSKIIPMSFANFMWSRKIIIFHFKGKKIRLPIMVPLLRDKWQNKCQCQKGITFLYN